MPDNKQKTKKTAEQGGQVDVNVSTEHTPSVPLTAFANWQPQPRRLKKLCPYCYEKYTSNSFDSGYYVCQNCGKSSLEFITE